MSWPIYINIPPDLAASPAVAPVLRHNRRQTELATIGRPHRFGVALDVWIDGAHLWRSWPVDTGSTCDAWAVECFGPDAPANHDNGVWGVPGVSQIGDCPIPTLASLSEVQGLPGVTDLIHTMLAIALGDSWSLAALSAAPAEGALRARLRRSVIGYVVVPVSASGVGIRAMILEHPRQPRRAAPTGPTQTWRASVTRREVRAGAGQAVIPERTVTIEAPRDAPSHLLIRSAKAVLGLTGWPAQRVAGTGDWHLGGAPYTITIAAAP